MTDPDRPDLTAEERAVEPETDKPGLLWIRRAFLSILTLFLVLMALGAGLWIARVPLLQAAAPALGRELLGSPVQLTIAAFDLNRIEVTDVEIEGGPRLNRLTVTPGTDWADGVLIDDLLLDGLNLHLAVQSDGQVTVRGLEALLPPSSEGEEEAHPVQLPIRRVSVSNIALLAETPLGPQTVTGSLTLTAPNAPALSHMAIETALESPGSESALVGSATLQENQVSAQGLIDLSLAHWLPFVPGIQNAAGRLSVDFQAQSALSVDPAVHRGGGDIAWTGVSIDPEGQAALHLEDGLAQARFTDGNLDLHLPEPLEIYLDALPPVILQAIPPEFLPYAAGVPSLTLSARSDAPALRVSRSQDQNWAVDFNAAVDLSTGPIALALQPGRLSLSPDFAPLGLILERTELSLVRGLDLPRDVTGSLALGLVDLDLARLLSGTPLPALEFPYSLDAAIHGSIAGDLWSERTSLEAEGVLRLRDQAEGIDLTVEPGGRMRLQGLTGTGDLRLSPRLRLDVAGGNPMKLGLDFANPVGSLAVSGGFRLGEVSVALPGEAAPLSFHFARQPLHLQHQRGATSLSVGPVDVEERSQGVSLDGLSLRADHAGGTGTLSIRAEGMAVEGAPFLPGTLSASLVFATTSDGVSKIDGPIELAGGQIRGNAAVTLNLESDAPLRQFSFETEPMRFGPFDITMEDLVPQSIVADRDSLPEIDGTASLLVSTEQTASGFAGELGLTLSKFTLSLSEGALRDIETSLTLDLAQLPATIGPQSLSAVIHVPGLPKVPVSAQYTVDPASLVTFADLSLDVFDGQLSLVDTIINPNTAALDGTIRLRRLDIQEALNLIDIDGVEASGILSGLLPVRVNEEEEEIRGGALAAEGGGVIRIDNPTIDQALAGDTSSVQGAAVNLVADVLRDFRYDSLAGEVDLPRTGDGTLRLQLAGHNPDVLEGYPFEININLESDFRKIFNLLERLVDLSNTILGGNILEFR